MKTITIPVEIPSELLIALNKTSEELKSDFQLAIAVSLYKDQKITKGKAIQISGLSRFEFEKEIQKIQVLDSEIEFEQVINDIENLKNL